MREGVKMSKKLSRRAARRKESRDKVRDQNDARIIPRSFEPTGSLSGKILEEKRWDQ